MDFRNYDTRRFFLFGMQVFFGVWLLYVGLGKWLTMGPTAFIGHITGAFDATWSPHHFNVAMAWLIMLAEPLGALWILSGRHPRLAWGCVSLLMFILGFGQTVLMKDAITNWQYTVLTLVCAAMSDPISKRSAKK